MQKFLFREVADDPDSERAALLRLLVKADGSAYEAAKLAGVSHMTIYAKCKELRIDLKMFGLERAHRKLSPGRPKGKKPCADK